MFFVKLPYKFIKLIASPIVILSMFGLTACQHGSVMHSQSQETSYIRSSDFSIFSNSESKSHKSHKSHISAINHMGSNSNSNSNSLDNINAKPTNQYIQARSADSVKVKYVPVPVPGQLMPIPKHTPNNSSPNNSKTDMQIINLANKNAKFQPTDQGYFNSVMNYDYMPGAVYVVYTAPLNITDIMFESGEKIISYPSGDTLRWQIAKTRSGSGDQTREHLIIKPQKESLENTLLVTTDQRVYHLQLFSTNNKTYMVAVSWKYPESFVTGLSSASEPSYSFGNGATNNLTLDVTNLNFNYQFGMLKGDKPSWFPLRVFSSDRQTFIEFKKEFKSSDMPILYIKTDDSKYATMVNWRLLGRFMVVDQVVTKAQLVMGGKSKHQTIVLVKKIKS